MTILPPGDPSSWGKEQIQQLIGNVIQLATTLAGGIAIIYLVWGAYQYFTAYGNEERANKAKITILWTIVGLAIIIVAKIIVMEVWNLVAAEQINFFF